MLQVCKCLQLAKQIKCHNSFPSCEFFKTIYAPYLVILCILQDLLTVSEVGDHYNFTMIMEAGQDSVLFVSELACALLRIGLHIHMNINRSNKTLKYYLYGTKFEDSDMLYFISFYFEHH